MRSIPLSLLVLGASATIMDVPTRVIIEKRIIESRDLQTIQGVLGDVSASLSALNAAATAFSGDAGPLESASSALSDTLSSGATTVQGTSEISVNDAVSLQSTASSLQTEAQGLVSSLAAKKDAIQQAGLCDTVRQQSDTINTNSQTLINAVVSKVPQQVQSIASQLVGGFTATLQQNSANFAEGNCTNAAGSGGGGSSSSSSASSASSSTSDSSSSSSSSGTTTPTTTGRATTGGTPTATGRTTGGATGATGSGGGVATTSPVTAGAGATALPVGLGLAFAAFVL